MIVAARHSLLRLTPPRGVSPNAPRGSEIVQPFGTFLLGCRGAVVKPLGRRARNPRNLARQRDVQCDTIRRAIGFPVAYRNRRGAAVPAHRTLHIVAGWDGLSLLLFGQEPSFDTQGRRDSALCERP